MCNYVSVVFGCWWLGRCVVCGTACLCLICCCLLEGCWSPVVHRVRSSSPATVAAFAARAAGMLLECVRCGGLLVCAHNDVVVVVVVAAAAAAVVWVVWACGRLGISTFNCW